jgi:hypothetical protein
MNATEPDAREPEELPSIDALVAGTVALMTAWADPCPLAPVGPAHLRHLIARKVVSNLFFLQHHPHARPELRQSLARAHAQWVSLAAQAQQAPCVQEARVEPCTGSGRQLH